jgi:hypothetical protein
MAGYPLNFGVNSGNSVLQHPLYLKWNTQTISKLNDNKETLKTDIFAIMATNDNMPIIWYLTSLYRIVADLS